MTDIWSWFLCRKVITRRIIIRMLELELANSGTCRSACYLLHFPSKRSDSNRRRETQLFRRTISYYPPV